MDDGRRVDAAARVEDPAVSGQLVLDDMGQFQRLCVACRRRPIETKIRCKSCMRRYMRARIQGLTLCQLSLLEAMHTDALGRICCALCDRPVRRGGDIDHDHQCCNRNGVNCGRCVRGILCRQCNFGIGCLPIHLLASRVQRYLMSPPARGLSRTWPLGDCREPGCTCQRSKPLEPKVAVG